MADKKRLIDANALITEIQSTESKVCLNAPWDADWFTRLTDRQEEIVALIKRQHTADAVEVVRCKDCGKWDAKTGSCDEFTSHRLPTGGRIAFLTRESDFCSYGERRTDG